MTTTMSPTMPELAESLQTLVEARLDTIDRMLLGRVSRQDRLAIVREVESQIHDLLGERDSGSVDRDDVLAVLARLDPPEAYLPDEAVDGPVTVPRRVVLPSSGSPRPADSREARVAKVGGILGLISIGMVLLSVIVFYIVAFSGEDGVAAYIMIFGSFGMTFLTGLLAIVLSGYAKLRGPWAVVGLVTGILSAMTAIFGTLFLLIGG